MAISHTYPFVKRWTLSQRLSIEYPTILVPISNSNAQNREFYFSGASGSRSMTYFPRATLMIGTPGIFLLPKHWIRNSNYSFHAKSHLPYPSFQISIVGRHDVHTMFDYSVNQAIVCVSAFMITLYPFKPRILCDPQCKSIFLTKFF